MTGVDYMIYGRYSLLITAVSYNKYDLAELFLDMGADINIKNPRGETSLYIVCSQSDKTIDLLRLLLSRGPNINEIIRFGAATALLGALGNWRNGFEKTKILLEHGADPNLGEQNDNKPLQKAATENIDTVRILLEYGADINATNITGATALFFSCLIKEDEDGITEYLLEYGADPFIRNNENQSILNNDMLGDSVKEFVANKITELHKLNVGYKMLSISKGLDEDPIDELDYDTLEKIYLSSLEEQYNPEVTRIRKDEDLQDIRMSRFITNINQFGGKYRRNKYKTLRKFL